MQKIKSLILKIIPACFRHQVTEYKNRLWGGWKQVYYSHSGEDIILFSFFKGKKNGFYVDVGAHHPLRYSNTALLYRYGWRGINIEPDPALIRLFYSQRTRDINVHCGVAGKKGMLDFYQYSDPAFNTTLPDSRERLKKKKWLEEVGTISVQVVPLREVLAKHCPPGLEIDVLSVDVEGRDIEVLISNDWDTYRPNVVLVEDWYFDVSNPNTSEVYTFMNGKGYDVLALAGLTIIFVERKYWKSKRTDSIARTA